MYLAPRVDVPPPAEGVKSVSTAKKPPKGPPMSLDLESLHSLEKKVAGHDSNVPWKLPLTRVIVTELLTCLHPHILLHAIAGKIFSLVVKILQYYQTYLLSMTGYRAGSNLASFSAGDANCTDGTPQKGTGCTCTVGVDDLWLAVVDTHGLLRWVDDSLIRVAEEAVLGEAIRHDQVEVTNCESFSRAGWRC